MTTDREASAAQVVVAAAAYLPAMTVVLLVLAAVVAVADWGAVWARLFHLEWLLKPATLALLVAAAATAHLGDAKPWVVVALALGLVGDIALLAPDTPDGPADAGPPPAFLLGLGAFLLGHVAWIVAFATRDVHPLTFVSGLLVAIGVSGLMLGPVLRATRRLGGTGFAVLVAVYAVVLGLAAAFAAGTGAVATAIGGVLFLASDSVLARERFVARIPYGPVVVIVTYHLAQGLMLLGLIRSFG